jgi:hypothetical protein
VKRSLWKSEEKGISLASQLTKLETKFYSVGRRRKKRENPHVVMEALRKRGAYVMPVRFLCVLTPVCQRVK